jgi:hypothetical protein
MSRGRLTIELWWGRHSRRARAFFDSSTAAWTHAGRAVERLAAAHVYRGTFVLRPDSAERVGDFT